MEHKHVSSKTGNARKGSGRIGTAVFLIVSIVLIAGIVVLSPLGESLMTHVITPIASCRSAGSDHSIVSALKQQEDVQATMSPSIVPNSKKHETITIEERPFYILQMGAFTDAAAADQHASEILRMGAGGTVFQDGSVFRVFAAAYMDEASLKKVQSQVRADGFEATPYITESSGLQITLDGDQQAVDLVKDSIRILSDIPSELCELCLRYDKDEINDDKLVSELETKRDACMNSAAKMKDLNTSDIDPIRNLLQKYEQNISTFLKEHDTINTEMVSGALKRLQLSSIIDYILFFDRK